jgi:hypothetical protein
MRAALLVIAAVLGLAVPVALGAAPASVSPGQRIDMKVLLLSADGNEPGFGAWKAELEREGVPYTAVVATTAPEITAAQLYSGDHAFYQAVILASGDLKSNVQNANGTVSFLSALSDPEWAALATFERTFGIRQISDYTAPSPAHGLVDVGGASEDANTGTLTADGKLAFPYLKGPVQIANDDPVNGDAFGYRGKPTNAADWQSLLNAPDGSSWLGIYTHPDDGREELVMTVASNQFQSHNQLLRHGMLNWVTRGVYLGYERNYLELDVDDIFLGDDKWNPTTNVTDYDPANAIRMTPADVANAVAWQNRTGLKLNMVYNMAGTDALGGSDALLTAFQGAKNNFRWINHTYEHPNLDCQTAPYISAQLTQNQARFNALLGNGLAAGLNDPSEAVTGEHSGIANTRPGNPGTIDPPAFDEATPGTGGTLAAGTYSYGITATSTSGETTPSVTTVTLTAPGTVALSWPSVCHATSYKVYRGTGTGALQLMATVNPANPGFNDSGAINVTYNDTGAVAPGSAAPPTSNGAALAPYPQNAAFIPAMTSAGIKTIASDASKEYPNPPTSATSAEGTAGNFAKGTIFQDGPTLAVPRYPSNVYYNVANRADQLDEYNWIYTSPSTGGCVAIPNVTTCNAALTTWPTYLSNETRIMFGHLVGNDPRPHYFHQTNIAQSSATAADTDTTVGGTLYAVVNTLLARYDAAYDRSKAPLVQLTPAQIAATLMQQHDWAAAQSKLDAYYQDGVVHVKNTGTAAVSVPLTGTTVGGAYAGQRSGWTTLQPGAQADVNPVEPANTAAPTVSGTARVGEKLTAANGSWSGGAPVAYRYQWQRCTDTCKNIPGATASTYTLAAADEKAKLRAVVLAGNWVSSISQAASAQTAAVDSPPKVVRGNEETTKNGNSRSGSSGGNGKNAKLSLTKLKLSPRRFPVAHRTAPKGTRLDGTRISWKLNKAAKVKLVFQRKSGKHWVKIGTIDRSAKKGTGVVRFRGRFGRKLLAPKSYRVVVTASAGKERTAAKRAGFRVVRG